MDTYEVVEEETIVEHEACVVERDRLALVRGRDDDLGDALIFKIGVCPPQYKVSIVPP
jgi:hypothetical protein